jgi:hypothetical protein
LNKTIIYVTKESMTLESLQTEFIHLPPQEKELFISFAHAQTMYENGSLSDEWKSEIEKRWNEIESVAISADAVRHNIKKAFGFDSQLPS